MFEIFCYARAAFQQNVKIMHQNYTSNEFDNLAAYKLSIDKSAQDTVWNYVSSPR